MPATGNVTASYGVEGFTADHLATFKQCGIERVLIAYDRDEAGDRAAEKLAKQLMAEGLDCYRILFGAGLLTLDDLDDLLMRALTTDEAEAYLSTIGMKIGNWNQLTDIDERRHKSRKRVHRRSPEDVHKSYAFAQHIAGWVPSGNWQLLQFDNSTSLNPVQLALAQSLFFGPEWRGDLNLKDPFCLNSPAMSSRTRTLS